jgi:hypothetical protein
VVEQVADAAGLRVVGEARLPLHLAGAGVQREGGALGARLEEHAPADRAGAGEAVPGPLRLGLFDLPLPDDFAVVGPYGPDAAVPVAEVQLSVVHQRTVRHRRAGVQRPGAGEPTDVSGVDGRFRVGVPDPQAAGL